MRIFYEYLFIINFVQKYSNMEVLQYRTGNLFQIICKVNDQALKIENTQNHDSSKIIGQKSNAQDLTQIWMIEKIKHNDCEIINVLSDNVMQQEKGEIRLYRGEQSNSQLYYLQRATQYYYNYFWIRSTKHNNKVLTLEGILRLKQLNKDDQNQLFRFELVTNNKAINRSSIIMNSKSCSGTKPRRVIDVPEGKSKEGIQIIQYKMNKRLNQRWWFVKVGIYYCIKSFKNGLVLDICEEKKKNNTKIIQWKFTGATNQLWKIESRGEGNYTIRSAHQSSLVLGIIGDSQEDGGKLAIVNHDAMWRFQGFIPV